MNTTTIKEQLYQEIVYRMDHPEWYPVIGGMVKMPFNSTHNSPNLQELAQEGRITFTRISDSLYAGLVKTPASLFEQYEDNVSWWAS